MTAKDEQLVKHLLATFQVEAQEHIQAIASGLIELESTAATGAQAAALDSTFRAAHSLKGAARTVQATQIESLCQALESAFAAVKRGEVATSVDLFDHLHRIVDALGPLLGESDVDPARNIDVSRLIRPLQVAMKEGRISSRTQSPRSAAAEPAPVAASAIAGDRRAVVGTVRVATSKLDALLLQSEEMLSAKVAATQCAARLRQCQAKPAAWKKRWAKLRPEIRAIRRVAEHRHNGNGASTAAGGETMIRVAEFLEWSQGIVESIEEEVTGLARAAEHDRRVLASMVDSLLDEMKSVVMQPFATLLDVVPRFVRELSRDLGKEVELVVRGEQFEIDRRVLQEMKDPLIHLIRNSLHHGIEAPEARRRAGKRPQGTLTIEVASRDGSNAEVLLSDDGAGINVEAVKSCAVKMGVASLEQVATMGEEAVLSLIFQSGVSTAEIITDIAGRGLGLAIVNEKVSKVGGALAVTTKAGHGTTFRMSFPLSLARFRGVLVKAGEQLFVLPASNVERVLRVRAGDIKTVENRATIVHGGQTLSLCYLGDVLGQPPRRGRDDESAVRSAVLMSAANQRIAFVVDEVLDEQEVLVKSLGSQLARVRNIAGATILGNGKVVPIVSVSDLMTSAVRMSESVAGTVAALDASDERRKSVLVAEDSITSRILLKGILESAGYQVETAVDGVDAYTKLRSAEFDLVVSDVEMPRLDGFGLTAKLRADERFKELPLILVTALESRDDRERGIEVGADAYIVKSSFDQATLLDVIRRLL